MPFSKSWHHFLLAIKFVLAFLVIALPGTAYANINSIVPTPSSATISAKDPALINVVWRVTRTDPTGGTRTVSSPTATLQISGATVATLAGTLTRQSTLGGGQSATLIFNESLSLNTALARRIANSPAGSVRIIRTFSDTQTVQTSQIRLFTGAGNSGPLTVRRIDLAFENKSRSDVVYKDDTIRAIVDIAFRSSGILKGEWRIVEPSASLGSSGGRVLSVIRQNLVSSGEGRTRIVSPPLPTNNDGLYLVSFSVQDANANFEIPILKYFVLDNKNASLTSEPIEITILSPSNGADLNTDTVFTWQGINSAQAYQVELFNKGDSTPLTGKLVPATDLKLSLSALSLDWLESGYEYTWRIRAFGAGGKLIGQSEFQNLYMP